MRNSEKLGFPTFCRSGQRDTSLEEFTQEVDGWLPLLPEVSLPRLTGEMLAEVVHRKGTTAGSLGWLGVGGSCRSCLFLGFDGLARIFSKVEDLLGFGLRVCPPLTNACRAARQSAHHIISADRDASLLDQRPLSVLLHCSSYLVLC